MSRHDGGLLRFGNRPEECTVPSSACQVLEKDCPLLESDASHRFGVRGEVCPYLGFGLRSKIGSSSEEVHRPFPGSSTRHSLRGMGADGGGREDIELRVRKTLSPSTRPPIAETGRRNSLSPAQLSKGWKETVPCWKRPSGSGCEPAIRSPRRSLSPSAGQRGNPRVDGVWMGGPRSKRASTKYRKPDCRKVSQPDCRRVGGISSSGRGWAG